ncbi:unnamed protein product [Allacma fusca]|uniref:Uncharacterized protein n=1 Tax=Allacma fusca TaxID=39272 RepID=A0A8J2NT44_9HEXA|nr:unnamed protein product [Allacma fusca]
MNVSITGNALKLGLCGTILIGLLIVGALDLNAASNAKDDQLISLEIIARTITQSQISNVVSELEDSASRHKLNMANNLKGAPCENWFPQNAESVVTLRLILTSGNSTFSCEHNSKEKSCGKIFRKSWKGQTAIESNPSQAEVPRARHIINSKNVRPLTVGAPADFPDFPANHIIHLKILNPQVVRWESWHPLNADKVTSLELIGSFSRSDIQHLFSVMKHLRILCINILI